MKRLFGLFTSVLLLLTLTACGEETPADTSSDNAATTDTAATTTAVPHACTVTCTDGEVTL